MYHRYMPAYTIISSLTHKSIEKVFFSSELRNDHNFTHFINEFSIKYMNQVHINIYLDVQ